MTPERFEELSKTLDNCSYRQSTLDRDLLVAVARELRSELTSLLEREPVAWQWRNISRFLNWCTADEKPTMTGIEMRPLYAGDPIMPQKPPLEPKWRGAVTVYECGNRTAVVRASKLTGEWVGVFMVDGIENSEFVCHAERKQAEYASAAWCQQGGE